MFPKDSRNNLIQDLKLTYMYIPSATDQWSWGEVDGDWIVHNAISVVLSALNHR